MEDIWNFVILQYVTDVDIVCWRYLSKYTFKEYYRRLPSLANNPSIYRDLAERSDQRCFSDLNQHPITKIKLFTNDLWLDILDIASQQQNWPMVDLILVKKNAFKISNSKPIVIAYLRLAVLNPKYQQLLPTNKSRFFAGLVATGYLSRYPQDKLLEQYSGSFAEDLQRTIGFYPTSQNDHR